MALPTAARAYCSLCRMVERTCQPIVVRGATTFRNPYVNSGANSRITNHFTSHTLPAWERLCEAASAFSEALRHQHGGVDLAGEEAALEPAVDIELMAR